MDRTQSITAPWAVDAEGAARLIGISRGLFLRLRCEGRVPPPVCLGRRVLWRTESLRVWLENGCPPLPMSDMEEALGR